jgi:hypothetical protein
LRKIVEEDAVEAAADGQFLQTKLVAHSFRIVPDKILGLHPQEIRDLMNLVLAHPGEARSPNAAIPGTALTRRRIKAEVESMPH